VVGSGCMAAKTRKRIRLTPAQVEAAFPDDYVRESLSYGMQYYVAARFAAVAHLVPVAATLAHHALEALLKASAAQGLTKTQILRFRGTYGHDLVKLWDAFRAKHPAPKFRRFQGLIREINKFERIRFAEQLIGTGVIIETMFSRPARAPLPKMRRPGPERKFKLRVDVLDDLVREIFKAEGKNPAFYSSIYNGTRSKQFYEWNNQHRFR
jgi:hypothetical protein